MLSANEKKGTHTGTHILSAVQEHFKTKIDIVNFRKKCRIKGRIIANYRTNNTNDSYGIGEDYDKRTTSKF